MSNIDLFYDKIECTGPNLAKLADEMNRRSAAAAVDRAWDLIKRRLVESAKQGSYRFMLPRDEKMFQCFYENGRNFYLERLKEIANEADLQLLIVQPETFSQVEIWISFENKKGGTT